MTGFPKTILKKTNRRILEWARLLQGARVFISIPLLFIFFFFTSCEEYSGGNEKSIPGNEDQFTAVIWNTQTMFDGEDEGNEYAEFRAASGWNKEKYEARLLSMAEAITRMRPLVEGGSAKTTVPDFIGLLELENSRVLEDLAKGPLSKQGYAETFFGNLPGASLGLGVLSRFPFTATRVHSIIVNGEIDPRPILEVHVEPWGNPLIFFVCHWKSKIGGDDATETLRRSSARVIQRRLRELQIEKPGVPVIVMWDLNENHDEFQRRQGQVITALLSDDPEAAKLIEAEKTNGDYLILSKEKPPQARYLDTSIPALYTPWENELSDGSYYYKNNWETIDHFLLSSELFDSQGWDYDNCLVLNNPPFTNSFGTPYSYTPRTGLGLSDHLPLMLYLRTSGQ